MPEHFCTIEDSKIAIIESLYPNIHNYSNHQWLCEQAILAAKIVRVDKINFTIHKSITIQWQMKM